MQESEPQSDTPEMSSANEFRASLSHENLQHTEIDNDDTEVCIEKSESRTSHCEPEQENNATDTESQNSSPHATEELQSIGDMADHEPELQEAQYCGSETSVDENCVNDLTSQEESSVNSLILDNISVPDNIFHSDNISLPDNMSGVYITGDIVSKATELSSSGSNERSYQQLTVDKGNTTSPGKVYRSYIYLENCM
jgi:hypothetical protein